MSDHAEHHEEDHSGIIWDEEAPTSTVSVIAGLLLIISFLAGIALLTRLFMGHGQNVAPEGMIIEVAQSLLV